MSEKEDYIKRRIKEILGQTEFYEGLEYLNEIDDWKSYVDARILEYKPTNPELFIDGPIDFSKNYKIIKSGMEIIQNEDGTEDIIFWD